MEKTYILDTSTIVSDPNCLDSFSYSKIIIHISVLNELDKLKTFSTEVGKNARIFNRLLDDLYRPNSLIRTQKGSTVEIDTNEYDAHNLGDINYCDNRILACAIARKDAKPTIITKDISFRIRARALGIEAKDHEKYKYTSKNIHQGFRNIQNQNYGTIISSGKPLELKSAPDLNLLYPNECVCFTDENNQIISLGKKTHKCIVPITTTRPWGLSPKNIEQAFAIDLLLDPNIPLVTLSGIAGCGKSLLSVACGLESVINNGAYNDLSIYRPIQPVGKDLGYLPGDLSEKLKPWMGAISDSLNVLTKDNARDKGGRRQTNWKDKLAHCSDKIHLEATTHLRGRSIPNTFMLIDECQNTSKQEIKTIITRAGQNTKIILTGDIEQIDNWRLDAMNNGLTYVIEHFKSSKLSGHICLTKGERSPLASEAARLL